MKWSWINVLFSVTKIFFLLLSLSCAIVRIAFELVALIGLLKYWVLQTDWVWLHQEIWSSVAWLYSKSSWLLKIFAELRETEWCWWHATRYHNAKPRGIIKDYANLIFFKTAFLRNEMSLYWSWNRNNIINPKFKIFSGSTGLRVFINNYGLGKIFLKQ